jgi:hypothetical protein
MAYEHSLGRDDYEGDIDGVTVIWGDSARARLTDDARDLGVPVATIKALTECYLYGCAARIGCAQVNIL